MADNKKRLPSKRGVLTPNGTLSFPHIFRETARDKKTDDGTPTGKKVYEIQLLIPKTDRKGVRTLRAAIDEIGREQWGDKWGKSPSLRHPLRDGDAEADELTSDGVSTKGEKYPERLGHYYISARSDRPVAVIDRVKTIIDDPDEVYAGAKGRLNIDLFAYSNKSHGVGVGLNAVQKTGEGEPIAAAGADGTKDINKMFDDLDDLDDEDLDDEAEETTPAPKKKAPVKKAPAKKAPVVEEDEDDLVDEDDDLDDDDI